MRARLVQCPENFFENTLCLLKHFVVPEPQHAKSAAREVPRSLQVIELSLRMLTAVDLHNQTRSDADEIHYVATQRNLAAEAVTAKLAVAHEDPEASFGIGRIAA